MQNDHVHDRDHDRDHDHPKDNTRTTSSSGSRYPDDATMIVASTRVFVREISLGHGLSCKAGGIGEVCTDPSHRKKGLAKHLLNHAIDVMTKQQEMKCSLLHSSPAFMNVYETSANYSGVPTFWTILTLKRCSNTKPKDKDLMIRLASFPQDTIQLQRIHKEYSEDRFVGCIIRTSEYWNEYIGKQMLGTSVQNSMWVLSHTALKQKENQLQTPKEETAEEEETILAWMAIKIRSSSRIQLSDFGCCKKSCKEANIGITTVFNILLNKILEQQTQQQDTTTSVVTESAFHGCDSESQLQLAVPSAVYQDLLSDDVLGHPAATYSSTIKTSIPTASNSMDCVDWSRDVVEECDHGWMYKNLLSRTISSTDGHGNVQHNLIATNADDAPSSLAVASADYSHMPHDIMETKHLPHLIWPADSF